MHAPLYLILKPGHQILSPILYYIIIEVYCKPFDGTWMFSDIQKGETSKAMAVTAGRFLWLCEAGNLKDVEDAVSRLSGVECQGFHLWPDRPDDCTDLQAHRSGYNVGSAPSS